jgi:hypothetical protein
MKGLGEKREPLVQVTAPQDGEVYIPDRSLPRFALLMPKLLGLTYM